MSTREEIVKGRYPFNAFIRRWFTLIILGVVILDNLLGWFALGKEMFGTTRLIIVSVLLIASWYWIYKRTT